MALRQATAERGGSRGATAGVGRAGCDPIVEVPRRFLSALKAGLVSSAQAGLETALLAGRPHRGMECRQRLWMSLTGSSSIRRLNDCPVESGPERARPSRRVARGRETAHLLGERGQIGQGDRPGRQLSSAGSLPAGGPAARHRSARRRRRSRTHGDARGD